MRVLVLSVFALLATTPAAFAFDVTTCRTVVPRGEVGVLQHDIDCATIGSGGEFAAIVLERNAVLELNGYTLDHYSTHLLSGIECRGKCEIRGPGRLVSSGLNAGVHSFMRTPVTVSDVELVGQITGVNTPYSRTTLRNVTMDVLRIGVTAKKLIVDGVSIALGPDGDRCIDVSYASGSSVAGTNVTLSGCRIGIGDEGSVDLTNLTITDASSYGIFAKKKIRLTDSSVTGSAIDLVSHKRPILSNANCGTSAIWNRRMVTAESFGVCSND